MSLRRSRSITLATASLALLASAQPAVASTRYAAPDSGDNVGSCSALAPCSLAHAVNGAVAGDEVVVAPGSYSLTSPASAGGPIFIHGVAGQPRPRIVGAPELAGDVLSLGAGGVVRHLYVEGNAELHSALSVERALVEGVEVLAAAGDGLDVQGASVVRDSVSRATGAGTALQTKDGAGGVPKLLNVTAVALTGEGLKVKTAGATIIRSTVVRGAGGDIKVYQGSLAAADHSNFTTAYSARLSDGGANQATDPAFAAAGAGDLRPTAGSPLLDSGDAADAQLGAGDADRNLRVAGSGPDIGAYEFGATPLDPAADLVLPPGWITLTGDREEGSPDLPPTAAPIAGTRVGVAPVSGTVRVRPRGSDRFVALDEGAVVPVGSTFDTSNGVVALTTADGQGGTQTGRFWGGRFRVTQAPSGDPYAYLTLTGALGGCTRSGSRGKVTAAGRRVRRLWGSDRGGRFRTRGRHGQATVRGTEWLTEDRCGGTLYRVKSGAIVVRAGKRRHVLRAGQKIFLRR